jgi:MFS transporter, DHA1 family, multidrug resistance protein
MTSFDHSREEMKVSIHRATFGFAASLACLAMLGPFAVDTYLPAFFEISSGMGISILQVQQTLTCYILAFAAMNLVHGVLSDIVGRRPVILASLALFASASLGCAAARDLPTLFFFRLLQGASAGAGVVVAHAIVRDCFDGAVALRMVAYGALTYSIAPALAPVIGGYLTTGFGWRSVFLFLLAFSGVLLLASSLSLPETHPPHKRQPFSLKAIWKSYRSVLVQQDFYYLTCVSSLNFAAGFLYIASAPSFLMQHLGTSSKGFAWLFIPLLSGNMLGAFCSGKVAGRWPPVLVVKRGFQIMLFASTANLVLCFSISPQLPWSVVPLSLYSFGLAMASPSLMLMLLDGFPMLRGTASSLRWFVQNMLLAVVVGIISPLVSFSVIALAASMLTMLLLSFCCWMFFLRRGSVTGSTNSISRLIACMKNAQEKLNNYFLFIASISFAMCIALALYSDRHRKLAMDFQGFDVPTYHDAAPE